MAWPILGAIFKAVAPTLISKVFGKKKRQVQAPQGPAVAQGTDYVKMRKDSEAAGLNFFSAVRAGGASGYQKVQPQANPTMTGSNFLADVITNGANAFLSYDPMAETRKGLELELIQAQVNNLNSRTQNARRTSTGATVMSTAPRLEAHAGFETLDPNQAPLLASFPKMFGGNGFIQPSKTGVLSSEGYKYSGESMAPEVGIPKVTNPYPSFTNLQANPWFPDAETWEDRHGDLLGGVMAAIVNTPADVVWNTMRGSDYLAKMRKGQYDAVRDWYKTPGGIERNSRGYYRGYRPMFR